MRDAPSGSVFNVQGYSIHDGPGIRTTVFVQGCPLSCFWCQNPESQLRRPQIFFDSDKCQGCGKCVAVCPEAAIRLVDGKALTDRERCSGQGQCADACPNDARSLIGRQASAQEVFEELSADAIFYRQSGGGITLSGGEPLAQPGFAQELLRLCQEAGFHTTLDTSGFARWEVAKAVLRHVDLVLYDFKHMDSQQHKKLTGVANELILDNARRIHHQLGIPLWARVPIIPGHNDTPENIEATAIFIARELSVDVPVNLNAYHPFGESKLERLGRSHPAFSTSPPSEQSVAEIAAVFRSHGLTVSLGG